MATPHDSKFWLKTTATCLVCASLSVACATAGSGSGFHMYGSPLIEGEMRAQRPAMSGYDPFELGDHTSGEDVYVLEDSQRPTTTRPARAAAKSAPALSANRATGASQSTAQQSARPKPKGADPAPVTTNAQSALAAEYVWSMYAFNGASLAESARTSVPAVYRSCRESGKVYHHSRPTIGDLAFFHNTFDANDDGRNNDWYTHVAIVESVRPSGSAELLGYRNGRVERFHLNLEQVDAATLSGNEPANTALRERGSDDAPFTQYLSGQLFAGFCTTLGEQTELIIVDNWQPGMVLER